MAVSPLQYANVQLLFSDRSHCRSSCKGLGGSRLPMGLQAYYDYASALHPVAPILEERKPTEHASMDVLTVVRNKQEGGLYKGDWQDNKVFSIFFAVAI